MAGRAANLARELKTIKSELHFMQERCGLLEEENKRLRDGYDNGGGAALEEDDLVNKRSPHASVLDFSLTLHVQHLRIHSVFVSDFR